MKRSTEVTSSVQTSLIPLICCSPLPLESHNFLGIILSLLQLSTYVCLAFYGHLTIPTITTHQKMVLSNPHSRLAIQLYFLLFVPKHSPVSGPLYVQLPPYGSSPYWPGCLSGVSAPTGLPWPLCLKHPPLVILLHHHSIIFITLLTS